MAGRVLVDSSVWIEALRDPGAATGGRLDELIEGDGVACVTGLVLQEVLQGLRAPREVARVSTLLRSLPYLPASRDTHLRAAALRRKLREAGITTGTVDVLLAQVALDFGASLWSLDGHFTAIASGSRLRLWS